MLNSYMPSGRIGSQTLGWLAIGCTIAVAAAYIYMMVMQYNPYALLDILFVIGYGFLLGVVGRAVVRRGPVRNRTVAVLVALILTAMGLTAKVAFQKQHVIKQGDSSMIAENKAVPKMERPQITALVNQEFSIVYHLEFMVLACIAAHLCFYQAGRLFSESANAWASEEQVILVIPTKSQGAIHRILDATTVEELLDFPRRISKMTRTELTYVLHRVPGQEDGDCFLTIELVSLCKKEVLEGLNLSYESSFVYEDKLIEYSKARALVHPVGITQVEREQLLHAVRQYKMTAPGLPVAL